MNFKDSFFKSMAICSLLAGILGGLALALDFGYESAGDFDYQMELKDNPFYIGRSWIVLIMMVFTLLAFWGTTAAKLDKAAGLATTGFIFFFVYCFINICTSALGIFTINNNWAQRYMSTTDGAVRTLMQNQISGLQSILAGFVFVILLTLCAGTLLHGMATWKGRTLEKIASVFFLLNFVTALLWSIAFYAGWGWLKDPMTWATRILWIILFLVIAIWLWKGREQIPA